MFTLQVDRLEPDHSAIRAAADAIRRGELVIFPIETAYVIAADARNPTAVSRVFNATDRGNGDELSLLVSGLDDVHKAAEFLPDAARDMALRFWPGHMALIVDKSHEIPDEVNSGKETVFVFAPEHPVALALLRELGSPVAAANAALPDDEAPVTAEEAVANVGESVEAVLDAGRSAAGEIPTVIDVSTVPPRITRIGTIPPDEVRGFMGEVEVAA